MMTKVIFFLISILIPALSAAQQSKVLRIKNGQDATKHISANDRFQYPQFLPGKVVYTMGTHAFAKLNYCFLFGEIMYIDPKGDTLLLANNNTVNHIEIGKTRYYASPTEGHFELLEDFGDIKLTKKVIYKISGSEKKGAYQNPNELGSVANSSTVTDISGLVMPLRGDKTILLKPETTFIFFDANRRFYKASRNNLLKIFSKNRTEVEKFLVDENINFLHEVDIRRALKFSSQVAKANL